MRVDVPELAAPDGRQASIWTAKNYRTQLSPNGEPQPVWRFRDLRAELEDSLGREVTNGELLTMLLDVYALHAEREGRDSVAEAAGRPVATDGGAPR